MPKRSASEDRDGETAQPASEAANTLYADFLREREEVLRHKWLCSEQSGADVGFDAALLDWMENHRERWRAAQG